MFPALLNPLVIKYLFDEGVIKGNFRFFVIFGLSSVAGFTIWRLSERSCQLFAQKLKNKILKSRSQALLEAYHKISYKKLIKSEEGYFVSRVFDEARNASWPVIEGLLNIFSLSARCFGGMLVSLLLSWQLILILLTIVLPLSLIAGRFSKRIQHQSKQEQESEARLRNVITQVIRGYKANNIFRLQNSIYKVTEQSWNGYLLSLYNRFKNSATYMTVNGIFMSWAEMGVIIAAGYQVMTGRLTFGGFMGFSNAFWIVTGGILQLIDNLPGFYRALAAVDRVVEFENLALPKRSTTLANIVSGFLEPDTGQAIVPKRISSITEPMAFPPLSLEEIMMELILELTSGNTLVVIMHGDDDFYRYFDRVLTLAVLENKAI